MAERLLTDEELEILCGESRKEIAAIENLLTDTDTNSKMLIDIVKYQQTTIDRMLVCIKELKIENKRLKASRTIGLN